MTDASEPIDLTGYQIVIPGNSTDNNSVESLSAYELKDALTGLGYTLNVVADNGSSSVNAKSILIGKTAATAGDMPTGNQFSITEDNGTVQISASNYYGYRAALAYLKSKIAQSKGLPQALDYSGDANVANVDRAEGSTLRVMFYNVLFGDQWFNLDGTTISAGENAPSLALRQDLQREMLATYAPDVLGLQEYNVNTYHTKFDQTLQELGYTEVTGTGIVEKPYSMVYKADKVTLVECGQQKFSDTEERDSKGYMWAVFTENATGKQFAVFSTHFMWNKEGLADPDTARENNAKEILAAINAVKAKYAGIAVIMGGDLNFWNCWANWGDANARKPYDALLNGGLTLSSNIAGVETNFYTAANKDNYTNSYHGYFYYDPVKKTFDLTKSTVIYAEDTPYTLDYIFIGNQESINVKKYIIVEDDITLRASDHSPTYVDISLN